MDSQPETVFFGSCLDIMLASGATATHALSRQPDPGQLLQDDSSLRMDCQRLVSLIDEAATKYRPWIQRQGTYPPDYFHDGVLLVSAHAGNSLCTSLVSLAKTNALPLDDTLTLAALLEHLLAAFQGAPYEEGRNALVEIRDAQQGAAVTSPTPGTAVGSSEPVGSDEDKDGVMMAAVEDKGKGLAVEHGSDTVVLPEVCLCYLSPSRACGQFGLMLSSLHRRLISTKLLYLSRDLACSVVLWYR